MFSQSVRCRWLWANSVSFVHTFQWVWTNWYLCILVTRAIFHRGITPLIRRLCCVQVRGPPGGKSKWLCPKGSVNVSLCLLSCWYKEPCVEWWCDVWIYLCSAPQLFLHMCVYAGRLEIGLLREKKWFEKFFGPCSRLQGPSFPRSIAPIWCPMSTTCIARRRFWLHILVSDIHSFFCRDAMKGSQCSPEVQQLCFTTKLWWSFDHTFVFFQLHIKCWLLFDHMI